jgi:hypothetical protein
MLSTKCTLECADPVIVGDFFEIGSRFHCILQPECIDVENAALDFSTDFIWDDELYLME